MKNRRYFIACSCLAVSLAAALLVALGASGRARRSVRMLEDGYTRHVLQAQEHLQSLGARLGKTAAAGDARMQVELLCGIARQSDAAAADLTALPLSHAAMGSAVRFCNQVSEYALMQALLCAGGQPVQMADVQKLSEMEDHCALLCGQLAAARESMLSQSLRLSAEEDGFYHPAQTDARPLERLGGQAGGMEYPAMIYDGMFSDARPSEAPKALGQGQVDAQEAVQIARRFVGEDRVASAVPGVETGGAIPCWGVTLTLSDGVVLNADVTRQGGRLLWIMPEHASFRPSLTLEECTQKAQAFLHSRGYGSMEASHYQVYDGLAVIDFVPLQDGVRLYPDLIKVQLRMDTGDLVGWESSLYLMNHVRREALVPAVTQAQALEKTGALLTGKACRLCVIPFRSGEKLCWEVSGWREDGEYRVYADAHTGQELEVVKVIRDPMGEMAV